MTTLKDKVILITGSAQRIGRILSLGLSDATLILHYHTSQDEAQSLKGELDKRGCRSSLFKADLLCSENISKLFDYITKKYGRLDVLINNAASYKKGAFLEEDDFDSCLQLNLKAPLICAQHAAKIMPKGSSIINIIDKSANKPFKGFVSHSISKAALMHATKALALELAPNIRVNNLMLGLILPSKGHTQNAFDKLVEKHVLVNRQPTNQEIVEGARSLIENDFINSTTISLDGGWI
ncbi:MAG: Enoyl-[acyl-carrier-protein] reductase [NADPH] FabL [Chlamydiae bacterium]|nr:Enoyl-[acyl-carrier-protein] reductase [NADPH] FabL [Chlamydiota bacterium]